MNSICVHCKKVYKKAPKYCKICGCKTFESTLAETEEQQKEGTITWFACKDQLPPIAHPELMGKPSDKVLVWGKNGFPLQTYYVHDAKCWFSHNNIPFEITHWAYINEPE